MPLRTTTADYGMGAGCDMTRGHTIRSINQSKNCGYYNTSSTWCVLRQCCVLRAARAQGTAAAAAAAGLPQEPEEKFKTRT
jgi:hypothetical protein